MAPDILSSFSNQLADLVARAAPSVVQVQGRRRPATGLVYADGVVVTTVRALGREDGVRVRRHDGTALDAELAGWDPTTSVAVLRVPGLASPPITPADAPARVGQLALALARSWSNSVTATAGLVSVIGGPLATGRRRSIDEVIRTSAPMHDGFSGGAFLSVDGRLLGVSTSIAIRGLGVVLPVGIAWRTAATLLEHGSLKRGYLGIAGQPVTFAEPQRTAAGRDGGVLAVNVAGDGPAAAGGVLVGDVILDLEGDAIGSPDDLVDRLLGRRAGQPVRLRVLRGAAIVELTVVVGEREAR